MLGIFEDEAKKEGDSVTDALSTMLRLLGEESEAARQIMDVRSRMDPIDEEWQPRSRDEIYRSVGSVKSVTD